jgi:hypothetical protein
LKVFIRFAPGRLEPAVRQEEGRPIPEYFVKAMELIRNFGDSRSNNGLGGRCQPLRDNEAEIYKPYLNKSKRQ